MDIQTQARSVLLEQIGKVVTIVWRGPGEGYPPHLKRGLYVRTGVLETVSPANALRLSGHSGIAITPYIIAVLAEDRSVLWESEPGEADKALADMVQSALAGG